MSAASPSTDRSTGQADQPKRNTHGCCADKVCTDKTCMELPAGSTCGDCANFRHCAAFYAHKATDTYCDFYPRRFRASLAGGEQSQSKGEQA